MSLETLKSDLKDLEGQLASAEKTVANGSGKARDNATSLIADLTPKIQAVKLGIADLSKEVEGKKQAKSLADLKLGTKVVVKNVGNHLLSNGGVRFSPGIEMPTLLTGFVKDQVAAGHFIWLADK